MVALVRRSNGLLFRQGGSLIRATAASLAAYQACCCGTAVCCSRDVPGGSTNPLPTTLNIDVSSGATQGCSCMGAAVTSGTLTWSAVNNYWEGTIDMSSVGSCSGTMKVRFSCSSDQCTNTQFLISLVEWGPCTAGSCCADCDDPEDPLDLQCEIASIGGIGCCGNISGSSSINFRVYE